MNQARRYIPTLDGWRALAILAVMFYHLPALSIFGHSLRRVQDLGQNGVTIFFVISGFLICTRLLNEERDTGSVSLKSFYLRRLFRIQPAALVYLFTLVALFFLNWIPFRTGAWVTALLACRNFYPHALWDLPGAPYTNHFWSLGVEEHFYLIMPLLLLLTRRGNKRLFTFGIIALVSFLWARVGGHLHLQLSHTDLSFELLMMPTLAAAMLHDDARFRILLTGRRMLSVAIVLAALMFVQGFVLSKAISTPLYLFLFMTCVFGTALHPDFVVSKLLDTSILRFVGRISYSLYLWQQLFLMSPKESLARGPIAVLQNVHIGWLAALSLAVLSYYCIEKPMVRLGHRLTASKGAAAA